MFDGEPSILETNSSLRRYYIWSKVYYGLRLYDNSDIAADNLDVYNKFPIAAMTSYQFCKLCKDVLYESRQRSEPLLHYPHLNSGYGISQLSANSLEDLRALLHRDLQRRFPGFTLLASPIIEGDSKSSSLLVKLAPEQFHYLFLDIWSELLNRENTPSPGRGSFEQHPRNQSQGRTMISSLSDSDLEDLIWDMIDEIERRFPALAHHSDDDYERIPEWASHLLSASVSCVSVVFPNYVLRRLKDYPGDSTNWNELSNLLDALSCGDEFDVLLSFQSSREISWKLLLSQSQPNYVKAHRLIRKDNEEIRSLLFSVLDDGEKFRRFITYQGGDAQILLDLLQDVLNSSEASEPSPRVFRKALVRLSQNSGLHPRCITVKSLDLIGNQPISGGAYADVWKGSIGSLLLATKIIRVFENTNRKELLKNFLREALVWSQLKHPNLLPFHGIYELPDRRLCLLSPWMDQGNLPHYIQTNPTCDRILLAHDIAHGVDFLHGEGVVHGDLKGLNILITHLGRACIADFGLAKFAETQSKYISIIRSSGDSVKGGTVRWQAPELFREGQTNSIESDVYSLGLVFYEVFAGEPPFSDIRNDVTVMFKVIGGERPCRPRSYQETAEAFWDLMGLCWSHDAANRPSASDVVGFIHDYGEVRCPAPSWTSNDFRDVRKSWDIFPFSPSIDDIKRVAATQKSA